MSEKRRGPMVTVKANCQGCEYCEYEPYRVQGDSGGDVTCSHPETAGRSVGDTCWNTPKWCPFLSDALAAAKERM